MLLCLQVNLLLQKGLEQMTVLILHGTEADRLLALALHFPPPSQDPFVPLPVPLYVWTWNPGAHIVF